MREPEVVLDVSGLNVSFKSAGKLIPAVQDLSFSLRKGEVLALVGESGCGKSTTAQAIMRLLPSPPAIMSGKHILFEGRDLLRLSERKMTDIRGNRISMIFQDPLSTLNPVMKIGDQIAETLVRHEGIGWDDGRKRAVQLLDMVRIPDAPRRAIEFPHQFSGGMRQRVAIATAIATRPAILIADEPTTALDVTIQAQILDLISELQRDEGMSILFVTHDMGVVAETADRMIVMHGGKSVESGETAQIFSSPENAYTRTLLAAVPRLGEMADIARPMTFETMDPTTGVIIPAQEMPETISNDALPIVEAQGMTLRFDIKSGLFGGITGRVHAVEKVSFSIRPGETLSIVGESGCGKSTAGRAIMRLLHPTEGSIRVDGADISGLSDQKLKEMRSQIQMVFQDPHASLDPRMSVGASIAEPLLVHGLMNRKQAAEEVSRLLQRVGLDPAVATRLPHEFSGGQRQRICIARALSLKPRLIVADESVSALDVSIKAQVVNLLIDLQMTMNMAYLFISHDMAIVERISHRVAVMYLGEIVEIGSRQAVFSNPQHPYTRKLLSAVPVPDPRQRHNRRRSIKGELKSPVRSVDYIPPQRSYNSVAPDHMVMEWGRDWQS